MIFAQLVSVDGKTSKTIVVANETTTQKAYQRRCELLVTEIALNKDRISLLPGKTFVIKTAIMPENKIATAVKWESSNKTIATVDKYGRVKGIKKGKATITVRTKCGNKKASCIVNVK